MLGRGSNPAHGESNTKGASHLKRRGFRPTGRGPTRAPSARTRDILGFYFRQVPLGLIWSHHPTSAPSRTRGYFIAVQLSQVTGTLSYPIPGTP
jgi:hypothetical protein